MFLSRFRTSSLTSLFTKLQVRLRMNSGLDTPAIKYTPARNDNATSATGSFVRGHAASRISPLKHRTFEHKTFGTVPTTRESRPRWVGYSALKMAGTQHGWAGNYRPMGKATFANL